MALCDAGMCVTLALNMGESGMFGVAAHTVLCYNAETQYCK